MIMLHNFRIVLVFKALSLHCSMQQNMSYNGSFILKNIHKIFLFQNQKSGQDFKSTFNVNLAVDAIKQHSVEALLILLEKGSS